MFSKAGPDATAWHEITETPYISFQPQFPPKYRNTSSWNNERSTASPRRRCNSNLQWRERYRQGPEDSISEMRELIVGNKDEFSSISQSKDDIGKLQLPHGESGISNFYRAPIAVPQTIFLSPGPYLDLSILRRHFKRPSNVSTGRRSLDQQIEPNLWSQWTEFTSNIREILIRLVSNKYFHLHFVDYTLL